MKYVLPLVAGVLIAGCAGTGDSPTEPQVGQSQSNISESGDAGRPVVLDEQNPMSKAFTDMAKRVAQQVAICNAAANNKTLVNN